MTRQLILLASAIVLALSTQVADASMARITCHCEGGDIQGERLPSLRMPVTARVVACISGVLGSLLVRYASESCVRTVGVCLSATAGVPLTSKVRQRPNPAAQCSQLCATKDEVKLLCYILHQLGLLVHVRHCRCAACS